MKTYIYLIALFTLSSCFSYKKEHKEQAILYNEGEYNLRFPSRYFVSNNFLFYWADSARATSREVYDVMLKFNALDTINKSHYTPDSNLKTSYWYFVCKNNLKNYKVIKKIWVRDYEYPNLNCN